MRANITQLSHVLSTLHESRITAWYFVDRPRTDRMTVRPRFAYEILFDPVTTEWRFPREEIIRRVSR